MVKVQSELSRLRKSRCEAWKCHFGRKNIHTFARRRISCNCLLLSRIWLAAHRCANTFYFSMSSQGYLLRTEKCYVVVCFLPNITTWTRAQAHTNNRTRGAPTQCPKRLWQTFRAGSFVRPPICPENAESRGRKSIFYVCEFVCLKISNWKENPLADNWHSNSFIFFFFLSLANVAFNSC